MKNRPAIGSLKPRNGHLASALFRRAGAHGKSKKAQRQSDRLDLQNQIRSGKGLRLDDHPEMAGVISG